MQQSGRRHCSMRVVAPWYFWYACCVQSAARPSLSPLLNGAKGRSFRCSGTVQGPQPSGLSWMSGTAYGSILPTSSHSSLFVGLLASAAPATRGAKTRQQRRCDADGAGGVGVAGTVGVSNTRQGAQWTKYPTMSCVALSAVTAASPHDWQPSSLESGACC